MATTTTLKTSKTPGIIVTEIRMMRATFKGTHFLVEGDDDSKFWKPRLTCGNVSLVSCEGKPNLIGAANQISNAAIPSIVGVYDPDFERLQGIFHLPNLLVPTDSNDLETTLLRSKAFDTLLFEYGDTELIEVFETNSGVTVSEYIERTACEFGRLRFLSNLLGHKVDFDRLSPYRFISADDWALDLVALKTEYAALASISLPNLDAALSAHCPVAPAWSYAQGHDAVRIVAQGLRRTIGRRQMNEQDVTRVLRIAYSFDMLKQSAMYASLCSLEVALPSPLFA